MNRYARIASISIGLALLLGYSGAAMAQQSPIAAIDIALEPDATMVHKAEAVNAGLRSVFPKGFSLDTTHHPHITMLQRFVRTADLDKIYAAADKVFISYNVTSFKLKASNTTILPTHCCRAWACRALSWRPLPSRSSCNMI